MSRKPKTTALGVFDMSSGAVLPGVRLELSKGHSPNPFRGGWHKMAHDGWLKIARAGLTGTTHRVLFMLFYMVRDGNRIEVAQAALAEDLGLPRPNITASITELAKADIIQRAERGVYFLNPHIGFIGDSEAHQAAIVRWDEFKRAAIDGNTPPIRSSQPIIVSR